jgi:rubrerythrin
VKVDNRQLEELIEQSEDLQSEAIRDAKASIPDLKDLAADRRHTTPDPADVARLDESRRGLLRTLGLSAGGLAGRGLFAGGIGLALASIVGKPAAADTALDVQMLQTASSLERLAVDTYAAALTLPFIKDGNKTVVAFAQTTMKQHDQHRQAFQAQTQALGGKVQDAPNSKFKPVVDAAVPTLKTPVDVVKLAATLEKVATDTYLVDLTMLADMKSKQVMGSVMGVEAQHLAVLLAVQALLEGGGESLIAIPTMPAKLPAAAGSVAFPQAFEMTTTEGIAPPESGALK